MYLCVWCPAAQLRRPLPAPSARYRGRQVSARDSTGFRLLLGSSSKISSSSLSVFSTFVALQPPSLLRATAVILSVPKPLLDPFFAWISFSLVGRNRRLTFPVASAFGGSVLLLRCPPGLRHRFLKRVERPVARRCWRILDLGSFSVSSPPLTTTRRLSLTTLGLSVPWRLYWPVVAQLSATQSTSFTPACGAVEQDYICLGSVHLRISGFSAGGRHSYFIADVNTAAVLWKLLTDPLARTISYLRLRCLGKKHRKTERRVDTRIERRRVRSAKASVTGFDEYHHGQWPSRYQRARESS